MLTFEGSPIQGVRNIIEKLTVRSRHRGREWPKPTCYAVPAILESAAQGDDTRRAAFFPVHCVAYRERYRPARGEYPMPP